MPGIYFVNKQHEVNFKRTLLKWNNAKNNTEYGAACYILSLPIIFEKVEKYIGEFENPVSWIFPYEWKHTISKLEEYELDEEMEEKIPYDLTSSMVQLGKFAMNMWNGYEHFNLLDCISSLDEENYKVMKCAMDMRLRKVVY